MRGNLDRIARIGRDAVRLVRRSGIPLLYFDGTPNVGDLVSVYLVERISGQPVYRVASNALPHLSAVGSTLGSVSPMTHIWGSGSIDGAFPRRGIAPAKVHALRGRRSQDVVEAATGQPLNVALGDPAILMPDFHDRAVPVVHEIGIIPHFSEYEAVKELLGAGLDGAKLIDVRQEPEAFIEDLRACRAVMSSSLHGLILADAYEVPNTWFSASGNLLGGRWKFDDYYSVTDAADRAPVSIDSAEALAEAVLLCAEKAGCCRFIASKAALLDAFPARYLGQAG